MQKAENPQRHKGYNDKKIKITDVSEFSILPIHEFEKSKISERFLLLQILVVRKYQDSKSKK